MEIVMQRRTQEFEGYTLEPDGATFGQALRTRDISIPSYREELRRLGIVQLTQDNGNTSVRGLRTTPPDLNLCAQVADEIAARRPAAIEAMVSAIKEEELEMKDAALGRDERGYMRLRVKAMKHVVEMMEAEASITPEELYQWFRTEDVRLRGNFVSPELRQSLAVLRDEQELVRA